MPALLDLARAGSIRLLLPGFSVGEPYEAWVRRTRRRAEVRQHLRAEIGELSRSRPYAGLAASSAGVLDKLNTSSREEKHGLDRVIGDVLEHADLISVSAEVFRAAKAVEAEFDLTPQDAIVLASVLDDLASVPDGEKCFVTSNARDFNKPAVRERLAQHGCRLMTRFGDAVGFIRSRN